MYIIIASYRKGNFCNQNELEPVDFKVTFCNSNLRFANLTFLVHYCKVGLAKKSFQEIHET